jgi:hypothetical protein
VSVVLPESMWALMPMFRSLRSSSIMVGDPSAALAGGGCLAGCWAVLGEGPGI